MEGLDYLVLDTASRDAVQAAVAWPIPVSAVGPTLVVAILILVLIALGDLCTPAKGHRR